MTIADCGLAAPFLLPLIAFLLMRCGWLRYDSGGNEMGTRTTSPQQYVHVETAVTLRDRAASIRWVAGTQRLQNEAKALLEFAEHLEAQAFNAEAFNKDVDDSKHHAAA
jgi:hypothetical protein